MKQDYTLIVKLAWRNIWRNIRRTLITLSAVCFGLASVILFFGFTDGFHTQWIDNMVRTYSGHIKIHARGYNDDPRITSAMRDPAEALRAIEELTGVEAATMRVEIEGLASTAENSAGVMVRGIDLENEGRITGIERRIIEGEFLSLEGKSTIIGHRLAKKLNAGLGEKIVVMAQAADGTLSAELFRVAGLFRMGAIEFDSSVALITIEDARKFAELKQGGATEIAMLLDDTDDVAGAAAILKQTLGPLGYEVLTWPELMPAIMEMIRLDDVFMYVILLIVLVVVAFGILNTMLMSITERTREFGIMMALGTRPGFIVALVLTEALFIGIAGTAGGVAIGTGLNALLAIQGMDLSSWAGAMEFFATLNPIVYPETHLDSIAWSCVMIFATAIASAVYPAVRASRLRPVEAIHYI